MQAAAHSRPQKDADRLRVLSAFSNELCDTVAGASPDTVDEALGALLERYKGSLNLSPRRLPQLLVSAQESFKDRYATLLNLDPEHSAFFRNTMAMSGQAASAKPRAGASPAARTLPAGAANGPVRPLAEGSTQPGSPALASGAESARGALVIVAGQGPMDARPGPAVDEPGLDPKAARVYEQVTYIDSLLSQPQNQASEALTSILQAFATGFGFRRALVLAPGRERATLRVHCAWGEDSSTLKDELCVPVQSSLSTDVFSLAYYMGKEVMITDAFDETNVSRIPRSYYEMIGSAAFVIYPCGMRGSGIKLLFADTDSLQVLPSASTVDYVNHFRELVACHAMSASGTAHRQIRRFVPRRVV